MNYLILLILFSEVFTSAFKKHDNTGWPKWHGSIVDICSKIGPQNLLVGQFRAYHRLPIVACGHLGVSQRLGLHMKIIKHA
jgi:hypothetical protein